MQIVMYVFDWERYAKFKDGWYLFDDSRVVSINKSDVMTSAAYMLFYIQREADQKNVNNK